MKVSAILVKGYNRSTLLKTLYLSNSLHPDPPITSNPAAHNTLRYFIAKQIDTAPAYSTFAPNTHSDSFSGCQQTFASVHNASDRNTHVVPQSASPTPSQQVAPFYSELEKVLAKTVHHVVV
jgi:hypothetical protein